MSENKTFINESHRIVAGILDIGELLLTSGAEVMRVEDTITRLCDAYGFISSDVLTILSSIILTATDRNGDIITQTRRIKSRDTNLTRVERLNALSRRIVADPMPSDVLAKAVEEASQVPLYSQLNNFITYGFNAAVFTIFFGGDFIDFCVSFLIGLGLYIYQQLGSKLRMNGILLNLLCSALMALSVVGLHTLGLGHNSDKIVIGNIMLLIPGLALTTSLRDLINGDMLSAVIGFLEALLKALAIAIGAAVVLTRFGG
ncbi:MAG: threonine/serine exporter family protein [Clostridia bacterium]|nr:threonine/serine exporter family protein [Clostridia bacterium]